jgi:hypothetical protein
MIRHSFGWQGNPRGYGTLVVAESRLLSVAAWYDNEMGDSTRLTEMAALIAQETVVTTVGSRA